MDKYRLVEEKFIGAQDFIDTTTAADVNAGCNSYRSTNNTQEQWSKSPHHSQATIICCDDGTTMNRDIRNDQFKLQQQQQQQQRNIVRITQQAKPRNCITTAMNMLVRNISLLLLSTYYYYYNVSTCHLTPSLLTSVYIGQWDK
jgi:hypothetical protein